MKIRKAFLIIFALIAMNGVGCAKKKPKPKKVTAQQAAKEVAKAQNRIKAENARREEANLRVF